MAVGDSYGSIEYRGAVYVLNGPLTGVRDIENDADATWTGESMNTRTGTAVSLAGDANGDGYADLAVGADWESSGGVFAGAAYVVYGPVGGSSDLSRADAKLEGASGSDECGAAVSWVGDADGDARDDLLVGCPGDASSGVTSGAAYLLYGATLASGSLSSADARLLGEANSDEAGATVGSAGDTNGDGLGDLLIAAPENDEGESGGGAVYLLLGSGL